ncbi:MAG TPA: helix-turn-helix transcriptional regulator [Acidimicrobiales bacterium]|nr:helix-turn-helix transcriptional regulator [Acidimicrobiales bacterium]
MTPRNFLRACLLLLLRERPDYGYDLIERLGALGVPHEDPGAVYRTLRGLERGGLVRSGWAQSSAGPARRTYELTPAGQEALETCGHALDQCRRIIEGFLDRFLDATGPVVATGNGSG